MQFGVNVRSHAILATACACIAVALLKLLRRAREAEEASSRLSALRNSERAGRVRAERALKALQQQRTANPGDQTSFSPESSIGDVGSVVLNPVANVQSVFRKRHGCPRQGNLVPASRALITFKPWANAADSTRGLGEFSHVWILFAFDQNTNEHKRARQSTAASRENDAVLVEDVLESGADGSAGVRQKKGMKKQVSAAPCSGVKTLVRPPRLGGRKVGLYATRTPHRFCNIGLSCARLEQVLPNGNFIVSGLDVVDGTAVLDIKPYVPEYDSVPNAFVANWIEVGHQLFVEEVRWSAGAIAQLERVPLGSSSLIRSAEQMRSLIEQVIQLDPRSLHQKAATSDVRFALDLDDWQVHFTVEGHETKFATVQLLAPRED